MFTFQCGVCVRFLCVGMPRDVAAASIIKPGFRLMLCRCHIDNPIEDYEFTT
jgi:hypothetical protein